MNPASRNWIGWLTLSLGVFAYVYNLGSENASSNPDELLYWQITRLTAETGQWLPLQGHEPGDINTKPPALFWQGIVSTNWAQNWSLWQLRFPILLYTLATTLLILLLTKRLAGNTAAGLLAAAIFLAFFGTYRYGRVFLTSAPETFWLFLPVFILVYWRRHLGHINWPLALAFGVFVGIGLLYKSFALVVPVALALLWWTLHLRSYSLPRWIRFDWPKIAVFGIVALGVFSLWFVLDPAPDEVFRAFVLRENMGKFDPRGGSYLLNLLAGGSSIWRMLAAYPINAGLLALSVTALFIMAFRSRHNLMLEEKLLWIWILTLLIFFSLPNQRDERYLLPGMPALAVLAALHWSSIPRWTLVIPLAVAIGIAFVMGVGGVALQIDTGDNTLYSGVFWSVTLATTCLAALGIWRKDWTRRAVCPAIFMVYLCYAAFLEPFHGPKGQFGQEALAFARQNNVAVPSRYGSRDEIYRFALPGGRFEHFRTDPKERLEDLIATHPVLIARVPASEMTVEQLPQVTVVGSRLAFEDRFGADETQEMLRGKIIPHLFKRDLLLETIPATDTVY